MIPVEYILAHEYPQHPNEHEGVPREREPDPWSGIEGVKKIVDWGLNIFVL